ncbi:IS3 family transposase [Archangium sp.]|uniref:IS3 family transposase n=1 Tax=Archangium sp. TaxID=1872627 RepID=UPI0038D3E854
MGTQPCRRETTTVEGTWVLAEPAKCSYADDVTAAVTCPPDRSRALSASVAAKRLKKLECELGRQEKSLKEAHALIALLMQARGLMLGGRGKLHPPEVRRRVLRIIDEAAAAGARLSIACRLIGLSVRTLQRWRKPDSASDGRPTACRRPANRLDEREKTRLQELLNCSAFKGLSPRQIVPRLADQGLYMASEATMYRLLRAGKRTSPDREGRTRKQANRGRSASGPNQIWSWDITCLKGSGQRKFYYLYLVMDVFSRRIMGWRIHTAESARSAAKLIREVCRDNKIDPTRIILHADNGRPMKGALMLNTLRRLGIVPSFIRPRISNDNAFIESLFRTLKSRFFYPAKGFSSLQAAKAWVASFVGWYNGAHLHSGLGYVSADDRYFGRDAALLERRARLYERARSERPTRWTRAARGWPQAESPAIPVRTGTFRGLVLRPCASPSPP